MAATVNFIGTKKNPIEIRCSCVSKSNDGIMECILKAIQGKIGLSNKIFTDGRCKYIKVVVKKNDCSKCPIGVNLCRIENVVLPKEIVAKVNGYKIPLAG